MLIAGDLLLRLLNQRFEVLGTNIFGVITPGRDTRPDLFRIVVLQAWQGIQLLCRCMFNNLGRVLPSIDMEAGARRPSIQDDPIAPYSSTTSISNGQ